MWVIERPGENDTFSLSSLSCLADYLFLSIQGIASAKWGLQCSQGRRGKRKTGHDNSASRESAAPACALLALKLPAQPRPFGLLEYLQLYCPALLSTVHAQTIIYRLRAPHWWVDLPRKNQKPSPEQSNHHHKYRSRHFRLTWLQTDSSNQSWLRSSHATSRSGILTIPGVLVSHCLSLPHKN